MGTIILDPVTLTLEYDPFLKNFNLANNVWTVSARALIFHRSIPCDKNFNFDLVALTLESGLLAEYFNLVNNVWIVSAKALIFHMEISCDKIFLFVLNLFDLDIWQFLNKISTGPNFWKIRF